MANRQVVVPQDLKFDPFKLKPLFASIKMVLAGGFLLSYQASVRAELPVPAQVWATLGSASKQTAGNNLQITQHTDKAVLNWESFNVGAKNQVNFKQPGTSSIALNRIFQDDPSRILGKVTANGQIYLFNKNGFVFGKNSTVDTNTLVASALNMSDETFQNGGLASTFDQTKGAALEGNPDSKATIKIEKGAKIQIGENGRLVVAAPHVENAGDINADKFGQIILVGSKDKVYLQPADKNSPFAGLLVEVGKGGKVTNLGNVLARQGNITLAGFAVNQAGRLSATTSVNVNGSIRLLAREGQSTAGDKLIGTSTTRTEDADDGLGTEAKVTFEKGSVTEIVADREGGKAIDEQQQPESYLETSAHTIHLKSGSAIGVPSGRVELTATDNLLNPVLAKKGKIKMESGASIDVSGSKTITASVERNVVEVPVQSFELRDSPYQKGGVLQGQTVRVDVRDKNLIIDTSGALARIERGIDERLGTGGDIVLSAGETVAIDQGANFNISGGVINYTPGFINTTKLLTAYGQFVDIGDADPSQQYLGVFGKYIESHEKWGFERVWQNDGFLGKGRFEAGYTEGLDAGSLQFATSQLTWRGNLIAGAASGIYQRESDAEPFGGEFAVDSKVFNSAQNVVIRGQAVEPDRDGEEDSKEGKDGGQDLVFDAGFFKKSGIQKFSVKTLGDAKVNADAKIEMTPGGEFDLVAGDIDFKGELYSAGGSVRFGSGFDFDETDSALRNFDPNAELTLANAAKIDVSGRWVNDFANGLAATPSEAVAIDGGTVNLTSTGDLFVGKNAGIHADSGAWLSQTQDLNAGKAGSISLTAAGNGSQASVLHLDGHVSAHGLETGGDLHLSSGKIVIGPRQPVGEPDDSTFYFGVDKQGVPDIRSIDSFGSISLTSNTEDLVLKQNTVLSLKQSNLLLDGNYRQIDSGQSILPLARSVLLPDHLRNPVALELTAKTDVKLETGSKILADNRAAIDLTSQQGGIFVDGLISAPAGSINLMIDAEPIPYKPGQAIWLGSQAELQAKGSVLLQPLDGLGRQGGEVLAGGSVSLLANRGYVIMEEGSKIDVSGAKATLDILTDDTISTKPVEVASNAGKIALTAAEGAVLDGELTGRAGNTTVNGGRLDIALDRSNRQPDPELIELFPFGPISINVRQEHRKLLTDDIEFGGDIDALGLNCQINVGSNDIKRGGFDDLRLSSINVNSSNVNDENSSVNFVGDVELTAKARIDIDAPAINWQSDNKNGLGHVTLNTAHFSAGSSIIREPSATPEFGGGQLTVDAEWIDFRGASIWNRFSDLSFKSRHDIRATGLLEIDRTVDKQQNSDYVGKMVTAGNLNLTGSQLYPSTLTKFTFAVANNPPGKLTLAKSGQVDKTPLSAAGTLNLEAPVIQQKGTVKAPFGSINFTASESLVFANGSTTSVSGEGQLIPFGGTFSGLDWLYRLDSTNLLNFSKPPEKKIVLSAPEVDMQKGSVVDLSGGGDLLAHEFQPGIGGSFDYLDVNSPAYKGGYAIVPGLGSSLAPYDPIQSAGFGEEAGSQVYLSGAGSLPAGFYTLLPARYALLPGAYLVTPQANTLDQRITTVDAAGLPTVAGYRVNAATGAKDSRWSGFLVETGADIRKHSQYDEQKANSFYEQQALRKGQSIPLLPKDSGQMVIKNAETKLALNGSFITASEGGRGARLDIAAERLKIVDKLSAEPETGFLEILAQDLNNLKVDSLLLGGERSTDATTGETHIAVGSSEVVFDNGARVETADLIAVAGDEVHVKKGAAIAASGQTNTGDTQFNLQGDGALLRVSADAQVLINRTESEGARGDLRIDEGASLSASKSILIDASRSTTLAGDINMQGGSLNLSANRINIGEVAGLPLGALNLSNRDLQALDVAELVLSSRDTIDFYGNVGIPSQEGGLSAISFDQIVLNAAGFSGHGGDTQSVNLKANSITLQNAIGVAASELTDKGQGSLNIAAGSLQQGDGDFKISGFKSIDLAITSGLKAEGDGSLILDGNSKLTAGYVTTGGGKKLTVDATGHSLQWVSNGDIPAIETAGLGGSLHFIADSLNFDGTVALPSGNLNLTSLKGDLIVGPNANIDLSGESVQFADVVRATPGGTFSASAGEGKILLSKGSKVDISGGGTASGGALNFSAVNQYVDLAGEIIAQNGSVNLDVAGFSSNPDPENGKTGFDLLADSLMTAGISESFTVRSREEDIVFSQDNTIRSKAITLVSDQGGVKLSGTLNADGSDAGGKIGVYAGDKVVLTGGALLSARAASETGKGGKVILSSTNSDGKKDDHGIAIERNAVIDVAGGKEDSGGTILLRALRTDSNEDSIDDDIAISPVLGDVKGFNRFFAEGVKKYTNQNFAIEGEIYASDIDLIKFDTDGYMTSQTMDNVNNRLGQGIQLRPGIEINYTGDLTLKEQWNLVDWRYSDSAGNSPVPGGLVINTTGNLTIQKALTDGFKTDFILTGEIKDKLQTDESWSYQLAAGADTSSAKTNTAGEALKNLTVATNPDAFPDFPDPFNQHDTVIRTGTGDIELSASGDIVFQDHTAVYNAGQAEAGNRYGTFGDLYVDFIFYGDYANNGGDLALNAGRDIQGALSQDPFIDKWLVRQGNNWQNHDTDRQATAWAVDFVKFNNNIGAFGGGSVDIKAGRNINNLTAMLPTTGKQIGKLTNPADEFSLPETNVVEVNGGGRLTVNAGDNIAGGVYFVGRGNGELNAGGSITGTTDPVDFDTTLRGLTTGPQLLMGDSRFALHSNDGLTIAAVTDPMLLGTNNPVTNMGDTNFFSYGSESGLTLTALSGDVHIGADPSVILSTNVNFSDGQKSLATILPGSLETIAFGGDVLIDGEQTDHILFPSPKGQLNIFAKGSIAGDEIGLQRLAMSDYDPKLLPDYLTPSDAVALTSDDNNIVAALRPFTNNNSVHAQQPVHLEDTESVRIVTKEGDISNLKFNLPKKAIIESGQDISNLFLQIQHNSKDDASIVAAGRDIINQTERDPDFGTLKLNTNRIEIAGEGNVLIKSGRNIDFGTSDGLSTVGNTLNTNLSGAGANITLLAGLNGDEPNFLGLQNLTGDILKYAENFTKYQELVTEFMRQRTGNEELTVKTAFEEFTKLNPSVYAGLQPKFDALKSNKYSQLIQGIKQEIIRFVRVSVNNPELSESDALNIYSADYKSDKYLPIQPKLNNLANQILFGELNATGSASAADPTLGNERGFAAIEALYPDNQWKGDVNLFFSKLQTLKDGDINLLAPGGNINAGLAVVANDLAKEASELGIVVQGKGSINAFLHDHFIVNQSRVFALGGGDIMIWSSEGNIDAGRGAKSAIAAPPPVIDFDSEGNLVVEFPAIVSGSGIRTAAPLDANEEAGNVALFAPGGVVNAGEAGIGGNNVTISATAVLGANNIQVGGVGTGVPAASTVSLAAGLTGASNLTASVNQMAQASTDMSNRGEDKAKKQKRLRSIVVKLLGFGA